MFDEAYEKAFDRIQAEIEAGYDRIEEIEKKIRSVTRKLDNTRKGFMASENIERMLEHFRKLYEHMSCQERRDMYRLFIKGIEILPETQDDGKLLKSISFCFSAEYGEDGLSPEGESEDDICFTLDCTKLELTKAEASARGTYAELKKYILEHFGVKVSTLYIAQIKRKYGLHMRANYNEPKDPGRRVPICPPDKEQMIMGAMKHFKLLEPDAEMLPNSEVMNDEG